MCCQKYAKIKKHFLHILSSWKGNVGHIFVVFHFISFHVHAINVVSITYKMSCSPSLLSFLLALLSCSETPYFLCAKVSAYFIFVIVLYIYTSDEYMHCMRRKKNFIAPFSLRLLPFALYTVRLSFYSSSHISFLLRFHDTVIWLVRIWKAIPQKFLIPFKHFRFRTF